jgi:hypothetical protein
MTLDMATIDYFKQQAGETAIPYQSLIDLYLTDCATSNRRPAITWT